MKKELALHLDNQRRNNTQREHHSKRVGKIPIHVYFKKYEEPTRAEGFDFVENLAFVPGPFVSEEDQDLFYTC